MIRYSAQNNPDNMNYQKQNGGYLTDINQLTDKFMSDLDFGDSGEYSLSSVATGASDGTTTSTACFDSSSYCTCCDDEHVPSIPHDSEAGGRGCDDNHSTKKKQQANPCSPLNSIQESQLTNAAVTNENQGYQKIHRRTGENFKMATTTADEDFEAIIHRYEFKPNKVPFRRFTLDDITNDAAQQNKNHAAKTSSAAQVVGTFSRPVIVDQLRESEIQFEEEMEKTIRKLQKMERKLKEFDDSDYHTSEFSSTTPAKESPPAASVTGVKHHQRRAIDNQNTSMNMKKDSPLSSSPQSSNNKLSKKNQFNFDYEHDSDSISSQQTPFLTSSSFSMKPKDKHVKFDDSDLQRDESSPSLSFSSLDRLIGGQDSSTRIFGAPNNQNQNNLTTSTTTGAKSSNWKDKSMLKKTFQQPLSSSKFLLDGDHLSAAASTSSSAAFSSDFNYEGILKTSPSPSPPPPQQQQQQPQHVNRIKTTRRKLPHVTKQHARPDVSINQNKLEKDHHNGFGQSGQTLAHLDLLNNLSEEESRNSVSSRNLGSITNKPGPRNRATKKKTNNKKKRLPRQLLSADVNLGYEAEIEEAEDTV